MSMPDQEPGQKDLGRIAELMKSLRSGNKEAAGSWWPPFTPSYAGWRLAGSEASGRRTRAGEDRPDREAFLAIAAHIRSACSSIMHVLYTGAPKQSIFQPSWI
jgi:hypothetical protein